jgi:hypothetical protein
MPDAMRRGIRFVFTDIDDTLSTGGRITALAYSALERLRGAEVVIPVTGRPAGWCDHIARMWPVDGIVGENGAFYMRYDANAHALIRRFALPEHERAAQRARPRRNCRRNLAHGSGMRARIGPALPRNRSGDRLLRRRCAASSAEVDRIVALMRSRGLTAKQSSIHVNGWFGDYDKLAMTRVFLSEAFSGELDVERERCVFVGDSPNDAPMFAFFPHAVGVANVRTFLGRLPTPPSYITHAVMGRLRGARVFSARRLKSRFLPTNVSRLLRCAQDSFPSAEGG